MWPFHSHDFRVAVAPRINLGNAMWLPKTEMGGWFLNNFHREGVSVWMRKLVCSSCPKIKWEEKPYDRSGWPKP